MKKGDVIHEEILFHERSTKGSERFDAIDQVGAGLQNIYTRKKIWDGKGPIPSRIKVIIVVEAVAEDD